MSLKLKLFSILDSNTSPTLIGPCERIEGNTYAKLIPLLDDIHIVDWPFQFFDVESTCKIKCKLEGLNKVSLNLYVMPLSKVNLESKKHMCVIDLDFFRLPTKCRMLSKGG